MSSPLLPSQKTKEVGTSDTPAFGQISIQCQTPTAAAAYQLSTNEGRCGHGGLVWPQSGGEQRVGHYEMDYKDG